MVYYISVISLTANLFELLEDLKIYRYIFIAYDNTPTSSNVMNNNIRYIIKNVNSKRQNIYSSTMINTEVVCLYYLYYFI